jgi:type II secretory pathway predicted ATPase ExeA
MAQPQPQRPRIPPGAFADDAAGAGYFRSEPHHQALAAAIYRYLASTRGFVLVVGEPPASGEPLARCLEAAAPDGFQITLLRAAPKMAFADLVAAYSAKLGITGDTVVGAEWALLSHIMQSARNGVTRLLVIENADALAAEVLEDLHRFSRLDEPRLMPIVLVATPALLESLDGTRLEVLKSAVVGRIVVQHLDREEIPGFIAYQITDPAAVRALFPPEIIEAIATASNGDPALVNRMGQLVLSEAKGEPPQSAAAAPTAAAAAPAVVAETPPVIAEAPVAATRARAPVAEAEAPAAGTEPPSAVTEAPTAVAEAPVNPEEAPADITEAPAVLADADAEAAQSPRERVSDVRQMRRRAKAEKADASPADAPEAPVRDADPPLRRRWRVVAGASLAGALLAAGVTAWLWLAPSGEPPAAATLAETRATAPLPHPAAAETAATPGPQATGSPAHAPLPVTATPAAPSPGGSPAPAVGAPSVATASAPPAPSPAPPPVAAPAATAMTPPGPVPLPAAAPPETAPPADTTAVVPPGLVSRPAPGTSSPPPPAAPPPAPAAAAALPARSYRVQVGAMRTAEAAQEEWQRMERQYADLLGGLHYSVFAVTLNDRGTFYRLQAGPIANGAEAERLCGELKRRGEQCIVVKP